MRFLIKVNEGVDESVTMHVVTTPTTNKRANKRYLKLYLTQMGVPEKLHKRVLKQLGFWGESLGHTESIKPA